MPSRPLTTTSQLRTELTRGRKFNAEELQLMLLQLLAEAPAHGYELIKRLKNISEDYYRPSPGVLYPALAALESLDFAEVETKGRRKKYHLTTRGEEHLQLHIADVNELFAMLKHVAKKMLWFKHANNNPVLATEATGWTPDYIEARKALQSALLSVDDSCAEEQQRIAKILQRTAQEVLSKSQ